MIASLVCALAIGQVEIVCNGSACLRLEVPRFSFFRARQTIQAPMQPQFATTATTFGTPQAWSSIGPIESSVVSYSLPSFATTLPTITTIQEAPAKSTPIESSPMPAPPPIPLPASAPSASGTTSENSLEKKEIADLKQTVQDNATATQEAFQRLTTQLTEEFAKRDRAIGLLSKPSPVASPVSAKLPNPDPVVEPSLPKLDPNPAPPPLVPILP